MALVLKQVRLCDGACCREMPVFPNAKGDDCIYRIATLGPHSSGCQLMLDPTKQPPPGEKTNLKKETRDAIDVFNDACVNWPKTHATYKVGRPTGGCCWQWVNE